MGDEGGRWGVGGDVMRRGEEMRRRMERWVSDGETMRRWMER